VILGGTQIGGRGGCFGAGFSAFTLVLISELLLVLDVSSSYTPIVERIVFILSVISGFFSRGAPLAAHVWDARLTFIGMRKGTLPRGFKGTLLTPFLGSVGWRIDPELPKSAMARWLRINRETVRLVAPAWVLSILIYLAVVLVTKGGALSVYYFNSVLTLAL